LERHDDIENIVHGSNGHCGEDWQRLTSLPVRVVMTKPNDAGVLRGMVKSRREPADSSTADRPELTLATAQTEAGAISGQVNVAAAPKMNFAAHLDVATARPDGR
jgi:hypothetical protein